MYLKGIFFKFKFNFLYKRECKCSLSGIYESLPLFNLLIIVKRFSIAGYHKKETAKIGDKF